MGVLVIYIILLGYILSLIIIMGMAVPILVGIIDKLTGQLNIWKELKKNNLSVALLLASVIIGVSLIIG